MKKLLALSLIIGITVSCATDGGSELAGPANDPSGAGKGGSLARFAIANNTLFTVHGRTLTPYFLDEPGNPRRMSPTQVNFEVETIFPRDNSTLFIGSTTGMIVYDISNPLFPSYVGSINHVVSCDPVVANKKYAYVTLRSDNQNLCFRNVNRLDVVDISNLQNPQLVQSYNMDSPLGLALYGDTLLVSDNGVKVFDVSDPLNAVMLDYDDEIPALDIIPVGDIMIVAAENGLSQYRFKNGKLKLLSKL